MRTVPRKGWAEMIKRVYEIGPLQCPKCHGQIKIITWGQALSWASLENLGKKNFFPNGDA
ncbi:hypothetical protein ES703_44787 [subsurface metagenome]